MNTEAIALLVGGVLFATLLTIGVWTGKLEMRPFRTTASLFGVALLIALFMVLSFDLSAKLSGYPAGFLDGAIIAMVFTAFATVMTKVSDDAGESETIKSMRLLLQHFVIRKADTEDKE